MIKIAPIERFPQVDSAGNFYHLREVVKRVGQRRGLLEDVFDENEGFGPLVYMLALGTSDRDAYAVGLIGDLVENALVPDEELLTRNVRLIAPEDFIAEVREELVKAKDPSLIH